MIARVWTWPESGLQDRHIIVSIHHETGQLIRFRPDETPGHAGNCFPQRLAVSQGFIEPLAQQAGIQRDQFFA